jgi:hypothetical protein
MFQGVVKRGISTVPLTAVGERGTESYVVCPKLEGWRSLESLLLDDATPRGTRRRLLRDYGAFARRLHDAGIWQYDFNASNVLIDPAGREMKVIDFELMKLRAAIGEASRLRTLAKMNRIPKLTRTDRIRFLRAYFHDRADPRSLVLRLARLIQRPARLDAARFGHNCVRENRNFAPLGAGWYRRRRPDSDVGLFADEAAALAAGKRDGYRCEPAEEAIAAWREANVRAKSGGSAPLAVLVEKGRRGVVIYR